jgi:hypothetical protein
MVVEKADAHTASNYRGEGIGGIMNGILLWLWAAMQQTQPYWTVTKNCNNMEIIHHACQHAKPLPEWQAQVDAVWCLKGVLSFLPMKGKYEHAYGHWDDAVEFIDSYGQ